MTVERVLYHIRTLAYLLIAAKTSEEPWVIDELNSTAIKRTLEAIANLAEHGECLASGESSMSCKGGNAEGRL